MELVELMELEFRLFQKKINKQKKDIIRTYLPLQIAFGALALYLLGGVIKAFL